MVFGSSPAAVNYEQMLPKSNQPGQLFGTAKTHKFNRIEDMTLEILKFRPIIAQSGTYTNNAAQVIADYLKPLCKVPKTVTATRSIISQITNMCHMT